MHHYSPTHLAKKSYTFEETKRNFKSKINLEVSPFRHQRRRHEHNNAQGDLRKFNPPTFDGENMGEDV